MDMEDELKEEILRKCRNKIVDAELYFRLEENEQEEEEIKGTKDDEISLEKVDEDREVSEKEQPFEDILAEKRRKYSAKEEFIFLLYNDLLAHFITVWDGHILRKRKKREVDNDESNAEAIGEEENYDSSDESIGNSDEYLESNKDKDGENSNLPWKLVLPDEFANITFISNNTYSGRISRKMMEGEGIFRWNNGAQYKGEFEQNRMHGKGLLEWDSSCWYEGNFASGYCHGKGIMVDGENNYMYTGEWHMGQRHGNGYCRFAKDDSYDGDWIMDKMDGTGLRIYPSGARYFGEWENDFRHGIGTMVWSNGDVYRGEWNSGEMHGYGEYIWNAFFNKTLSWPRESSYMGNWHHGMRHGKGVLKLNTIGGSKYSGYWKDNKKHGYGIISGNNGDIVEGDPLFLNDNLIPYNLVPPEDEGKSVNAKAYTNSETTDDILTIFSEKPSKIAECMKTPILKPEQFPSVSYHISRLLNPSSTNASPSSRSVSSGKCYTCKDNKSCTCLIEYSKAIEEFKQGSFSSESVTETLKESDEWKYEERWLYNCLTKHMLRIRQIYNEYAKLFASDEPKCYLIMSRLSLWALWRDCGINKKLCLIEIDNHIANNKSTFTEDPYCPFEKIEIWQFLHALLEVSWHLYTKNNIKNDEHINGKLASGLQKLLHNDIYPNAGNNMGNAVQAHLDLLPIYYVYEFYRDTEYPLSARKLLRATCILKGSPHPQPPTSIFLPPVAISDRLLNGINCVTVGERITYIPKASKNFMEPQTPNSPKIYQDKLAHELLAFRELGASKMLDIMANVCPLIKDAECGAIVNINYEITFLEFYEIILEAAKQLLSLRKKATAEAEKAKTEQEAASVNNDSLQDGQNLLSIPRSLPRKNKKHKKGISA